MEDTLTKLSDPRLSDKLEFNLNGLINLQKFRRFNSYFIHIL